MRSPSSRVLINRVDIYVATPGRDSDGGVQFPYPASLAMRGVACTVQPQVVAEIEDQGRVTKITEFKIIFGTPQNLSPKDKIVWVDNAGVTRLMFVEADRDEAGRGAAFTVHATERV
jgi:hypothetical protein